MADGADFKIPARRSKAVPIKAPQGGNGQVPLVTDNIAPQPPVTQHRQDTQAKGSVPTTSSVRYSKENERDDWAYDVYARPYIPQALLMINSEPVNIINSETKHDINFTAYVLSFAGSGFLLNHAIPSSREQRQAAPDALTAHSYEHCFSYYQAIEVEAQSKEHESYALYKVPLRLVDPKQSIYSLQVPGLRENTPFIELGDVVSLRQLRFDAYGNLLHMEAWLRGGGRANCGPCPAYTAIQHNASVWGIRRASETLYLRIDGLIQESLIFNVVFPIKHRRLEALWNGLARVQEHLRYATRSLTSLDHTQLYEKVANSISPNGSAVDDFPALPGGANESTIDGSSRNDWIRRMLFPDESDAVIQTTLPSLAFRRQLYDARLNYEQLKAVDTIARNEYGVLPYLISGPPGTGKTKTLVETALQLLSTTEVAHILICAPSDPAADTLALRLREHLDQKQLFRLNGSSRTIPEVRDALLSFCRYNDMFFLPPMPEVMRYNVIVTSCRDAAILVDARLTNEDLYSLESGLLSALRPATERPHPPKLHWGALLMDEAAQATEPEAIIPLSVIAPPKLDPSPKSPPQHPQFIMAGDQNQLGPRTASKNPIISTSLFERIFSRPLYTSHPLSRHNTRPSTGPPTLTKSMLPMPYPSFTNLIRNYRSHPSILSTPSSLFYNDTLIPEATDPIRSPLLAWTGWRGRKWPVLFRANTSLDDIEQDGGGWYNRLEAQIACDYAARLIRELGVRERDICIMSPFSAQVKVLRNLMRGAGDGGFWDVNIGPLEAFQGLESRVVILCTTRTRGRFLEGDARRGAGIVGMAKRMNVAMTRAKEALVVVGNPEVLATDSDWAAFLGMCWRNGLWEGEEGGNEGVGIGETKYEGKVGLLERALINKEEQAKRSEKRALGDGATVIGDDMWVAGLKAALEDEEYAEVGYDEND